MKAALVLAMALVGVMAQDSTTEGTPASSTSEDPNEICPDFECPNMDVEGGVHAVTRFLSFTTNSLRRPGRVRATSASAPWVSLV